MKFFKTFTNDRVAIKCNFAWKPIDVTVMLEIELQSKPQNRQLHSERRIQYADNKCVKQK